MPVPMSKFPGALIPVPLNKIDEVLPPGDKIELRRVYPASMQPDSQHTWSREFLMDRVREHGAFMAPYDNKPGSDMITLGIPATDGGFFLVRKEPLASQQSEKANSDG